jgi:hypothetical protein
LPLFRVNPRTEYYPLREVRTLNERLVAADTATEEMRAVRMEG